VHSQAAFYGVWILLGIALGGTLYTPVFAVVTRRFPHDFRRAIITITFLGGLASTVMIPVFAGLMSAMGWRAALWVLAALQLFVCAPLHFVLLRGAPGAAVHAQAARAPVEHMRSAPYLLIGVFTVAMMAVTASLPPHMISLLRGAGLDEKWVIAIPASVGAFQVLGRLLLFFFESRFDVHVANRTIPMLIPIGLSVLLFAAGHAWGALLFVILFGLGNGMMTIVKGTAIAQYVSRDNIGALNGALGPPTAIARAVMPWLLGAMWSAQAGYSVGLAVLIAIAALGVAALILAQRVALRRHESGA
jgi:predicted MFS family arabinose efflux permease